MQIVACCVGKIQEAEAPVRELSIYRQEREPMDGRCTAFRSREKSSPKLAVRLVNNCFERFQAPRQLPQNGRRQSCEG